MNESDRKVSLAEVRTAIEESYRTGGFAGAGKFYADQVVKHLTKPRLKPDCPVLSSLPDKDRGVVYQEVPMFYRNTYADSVRNTPLIRADRVMEWAKQLAGLVSIDCGVDIEEFFNRRVRRETEVQE